MLVGIVVNNAIIKVDFVNHRRHQRLNPRAPLAIATVSGLLSATGLTLLVVPVLYQIMSQRG